MAKLIKRKDVWTVRYFVPKPLQAAAGRTEIWRSIGTAILRDAETKQHAKTQTWHLSAITSLFSWAILHDYYTDTNPWSGLSASIRESSRGKKKERRRPWSADELDKLDTLDDDEPIKQTALLCLYTGMRTDEACSLKIADVNLAEKYIEVIAGKSHDAVKVPVHRRLMPLVKRLHKAATEADKEHLIADLVPGGKDKKRSHNLWKRAGRWVREHVSKDENLVLYSVRHTFATALENAGVAPSVITRLLGQTQKGLALSTYSGGLDLPALRKAVDKLPTTWPTAE